MNSSHDVVVDTIEDLLAKRCGQAATLPEAWWPELWQELVELGFAEVGRPCAEDDIVPELAFWIARTSARFGIPIPLGEVAALSNVAVPTAHGNGPGPLIVAPPHMPLPHLETAGEAWKLTGLLRGVPWARYASCIVVHAACEDGRALAALIEPGEAELTARANLAGEARDELRLDLRLEADRIFSPLLNVEQTWTLGALLRAVELVGAMHAVLELALQHAQQRRQFGRPIGRFQAVQQLAVTIAGEAAAANAAANAAIRSLTGANAGLFVAAAKVRAGRSAGIVARAAHQLHGAIGYTADHPLHRLTRRLWAWRDEYGSDAQWARELGRLIVSGGSDAAWNAVASQFHSAPAGLDPEPISFASGVSSI